MASRTVTRGRVATTAVVPGRYGLSIGDPHTELPDGWAWRKLTDLARLESGHTPSRKRPEYWDGGVPWIGIKDATKNHGRVLGDTLQHVSHLGIENSSARILPEHTVCLSRTASVGYVVVTGRPMATSQDFVNWVCGEGLDWRFLKYVLLAETASLRRFAYGTTHQTIYFPEVKAFHVALPPKEEQERVASVLAALDDKVESNGRLRRLLDDTMRQLYFATAEPSSDRRPLSDVVAQHKKSVRPFDAPAREFEHFSIPAFDRGELSEVAVGAEILSGKYTFPDDAVALSKLNPVTKRVLGHAAVTDLPAICSSEFVVLRPTTGMTTEVLYAMLAYDRAFYAELLASVTGTTGSRQRVKPADVLKCTVPTLSVETIAELTDRIRAMYQMRSELHRETHWLRAVRDAVLPRLVSGRLRIPADSEHPSTDVPTATRAEEPVR